MKCKEQFLRTALIIGEENIDRLSQARVAVFGVGGVGGFVVESLARSGVGTLDLIDNDKISVSNINRQIIATTKNIGRLKVEVAKERCLEINPDIKVNTYNTFYLPQTAGEFDFSQYDYVVDAIDTVTGKIQLIIEAKKENVPIISSMGAGNKLDATMFEVEDIYNTSVCPLAKTMRKELKKRGVKDLKVVYSREEALIPFEADRQQENGSSRKSIPGSVAFVPPVVGLIIGGEVIKDLCDEEKFAKSRM